MPVHVEILLMTVFQVETESLHVRFCLQMPINNIIVSDKLFNASQQFF
jgi:hypothetical protein